MNLIGLNTAQKVLQRIEQSRYAASLMGLERRLVNSPSVAAKLTDALREIGDTQAQRAIDDPWTLQRLADAYSNHISPLLPRVMISGEPIHLKAAHNADRIRALLLAGLRAAVLWRQCGGSQLKLLLLRKPMQRAVAKLLD